MRSLVIGWVIGESGIADFPESEVQSWESSSPAHSSAVLELSLMNPHIGALVQKESPSLISAHIFEAGVGDVDLIWNEIMNEASVDGCVSAIVLFQQLPESKWVLLVGESRVNEGDLGGGQEHVKGVAFWSDIAFVGDVVEDDFAFENRETRLTHVVFELAVLKHRVMRLP